MSAFIPGLPTLPLGAATPVIATVASEALSSLLWQASQLPPSWGVFDDAGNQVVTPDSVLEFTHRKQYEISNFPVQDGQFASYNKVILPFEVQLRFSKAGTQSDRSQFLTDIENLAESLDLYTVVTPERTYSDLNLQRYEVVRRGARGAFFLTEVDVYFIEVIQVAAQYTSTEQLPNAQSSSAQPVSNVGAVQLQDLSPAEQQISDNATLSVPDGTF